jgi:helix-turn-helix protein
VSCGQAHSSARELVAQGNEAKLVAETLAISRSSLYYQQQPRGSRADRSRDEEIILACGEKPAYGYRRLVWWLGRKQGLVVNGKRVLRVMRERGLLVRQRRFRVSRRKDWGKCGRGGLLGHLWVLSTFLCSCNTWFPSLHGQYIELLPFQHEPDGE